MREDPVVSASIKSFLNKQWETDLELKEDGKLVWKKLIYHFPFFLTPGVSFLRTHILCTLVRLFFLYRWRVSLLFLSKFQVPSLAESESWLTFSSQFSTANSAKLLLSFKLAFKLVKFLRMLFYYVHRSNFGFSVLWENAKWYSVGYLGNKNQPKLESKMACLVIDMDLSVGLTQLTCIQTAQAGCGWISCLQDLTSCAVGPRAVCLRPLKCQCKVK